MSKFCSADISTNLQAVVDSITSSCSSCCFVLPNISNVVGISNYFTSTASLPDIYLCNIPDGQTAYVDGDVNAQLIASRGCWIGFDQRLLRSDAPTSEIWAWGPNFAGRLGDVTVVNRSSPVSVVGGFTDWLQVSAGACHSAAIRTNGTLWTWGCATSGLLGNDSITNRSSPVSVVGGFTDWCQVSAGWCHTVAIRCNGTLWAWGAGTGGRLGDNTITVKSSPVSVVGGFTDWCFVTAGICSSAAIRTNGTLWTWGINNCGVLGDNTLISQRSPVSVVGGFTDWCQVSVNNNHVAAIRTNGTLWTWGNNNLGQLGTDSTILYSSPVSVVGGFTDWCQVIIGTAFTAAVRTNGTLWIWGCNGNGRLGVNTLINHSSPVSVVGGFTDWCQVGAGDAQTAAVRTNGTLWTWGLNTNGTLGDNTVVAKSSPVLVVGGFTDWSQVSITDNHVLALRKY